MHSMPLGDTHSLRKRITSPFLLGFSQYFEYVIHCHSVETPFRNLGLDQNHW